MRALFSLKDVRRRSPDLAETADRRSPRKAGETYGRTSAVVRRPQHNGGIHMLG